MIQVKKNIVAGLAERFGIPVRDEVTEQGFDKPCFFVKDLSSTHTKEVGDYQRSVYFFDIHYFTDAEWANEACEKMNQELIKLFWFFEPLRKRPTSMAGEIRDGVLHFFVDFQIRYQVSLAESEKMEVLEVRSGLND